MNKANMQKRDYNFFSIAVGSRRSSKKKAVVYIILLLIYLLIAAGAYYILEHAINLGKKQIDDYNTYLTSEETVAKRQQVKEKKQVIDNLQKYSTSLDAFIQELEKTDIIGTNFIQLINSAIPEGLYFENVSMTVSQMQIQGNASGRAVIAEFLHNINSLDVFKEVHISVINTASEGQDNQTQASQGGLQNNQQAAETYTFTMSCQLKDVIEE